MPFRTGNKSHDDAILLAENVRQAAIVPGASMATVRAADLTYARSAFASCRQNNNYSGSEQFSVMMKEVAGVQS
jgi:hypothetical protein